MTEWHRISPVQVPIVCNYDEIKWYRKELDNGELETRICINDNPNNYLLKSVRSDHLDGINAIMDKVKESNSNDSIIQKMKESDYYDMYQ